MEGWNGRPRAWLLAIVLLAIVAGAVGSSARVAWHLSRVEAGFQAAQQGVFSSSSGSLSPEGIGETRKIIGRTRQSLAALRTDFSVVAWMAPALSAVPRYGGDLSQADNVLTYAHGLVSAAEVAVDGAAPALARLQDGPLSPTSLDAFAADLERGQESFARAASMLASASEARSAIAVDRLSPMTAAKVQQADSMAATLTGIVSASEEAPAALRSLAQGYEAFTALQEALESDGSLDSENLDEAASLLNDASLNLQESARLWEQSVPTDAEAGLWGGLTQRDVGDLLVMSAELAHAADITLQASRDVLAALEAPGGSADLAEVQRSLSAAQGQFETAKRSLDLAAERRARLGPGVEAVAPLQTLDQGTEDLRALVAFGIEGPELLGDGLALRQDAASLKDALSPTVILQNGLTEVGGYRRQVELMRERLDRMEAAWARLSPFSGALERRRVLDPGAVSSVLAAAETTVDAANGLLASLDELLSDSGETGFLTPAFGAALRETFDVWEERSQQAITALDPLTTVTGGDGGYMVDAGQLLGVEVLAMRQSFISSRDAAGVARTLLGFDGPTNVLVLGQDDQELRATGGFIGSTSEMVVVDGVPHVERFLSSYDVDPTSFAGLEVAPDPIVKYMAGVPVVLTFRDTNWSPDFPTSARKSLEYYAITQPFQADVVVAMDTHALAALIDLVGGISVPGWWEMVDGQTARDIAAGAIHPYPCRPENHSNLGARCFSEDALNALLPALQGYHDPIQAANLMLQLLNRKHILVYSTDAELQEKLVRFNWSGHMVRPQGHDYLHASDWTAYSKARDAIDRSFRYDVFLSANGQDTAELRLRYENSAARVKPCEQLADYLFECYWDYLRVYAPPGAEVLEAPRFPLPPGTFYGKVAANEGRNVVGEETFEVHSSADYTEMAGFFVLAGGQDLEATFSYSLPPTVVQTGPSGVERYRLVIQKQPGTVGDAAQVRVHLPEGATFVASSAGGTFLDEQGMVAFDLTLTTDQDIWVDFHPLS
jgi:hypothetical protein